MDAISYSQKTVKRNEISWFSLLWLFYFGSVVGFFLEGLWCILTKGHWESHSSTVLGPFCIIYGIGAMAVYLLSLPMRGKAITIQFVVFTLSGATVEYFGSLFQKLCFGSISWDYSAHFLNLGGRVSLKMALMWGILGILFLRLVFPILHKLLKKLNGRGWRIVSMGMAVFMLINLLTSAAAITRWHARLQGVEATNAAAQWLDDTYSDQAMSKQYPNMTFTRPYTR